MKKLICLCLIFTTRVFADCGYELTTPVLTYAVNDTNPTVPANVSIERKKDNGNPCSNFFLAFTKGLTGDYNRQAKNLINGDLIYYNIYKNSNSTGILKEPSDITSPNETLFGPISKNQIKTLTYYFTLAPINASNPPRSGSYVDVIQVQAYSGLYSNINSYEGYRDMHVYINVAKFTSLSLVDTGSAYDPAQTAKTLDFGVLEEDEEMQFDVRIVSNAGYILKVSSANNGILKRPDATGVMSQIAYDFYTNNSKKTLTSSATSPVTIASATGKTPAGGAQIPLKVVIKSVENKDPGTYQDYITLTVISND
jgi:spore coat protein U-like protein